MMSRWEKRTKQKKKERKNVVCSTFAGINLYGLTKWMRNKNKIQRIKCEGKAQAIPPAASPSTATKTKNKAMYGSTIRIGEAWTKRDSWRWKRYLVEEIFVHFFSKSKQTTAMAMHEVIRSSNFRSNDSYKQKEPFRQAMEATMVKTPKMLISLNEIKPNGRENTSQAKPSQMISLVQNESIRMEFCVSQRAEEEEKEENEMSRCTI